MLGATAAARMAMPQPTAARQRALARGRERAAEISPPLYPAGLPELIATQLS